MDIYTYEAFFSEREKRFMLLKKTISINLFTYINKSIAETTVSNYDDENLSVDVPVLPVVVKQGEIHPTHQTIVSVACCYHDVTSATRTPDRVINALQYRWTSLESYRYPFEQQ